MNLLRACAEHEAAHAVVSAHYGMRVHEIRVGANGSGQTLHEVRGSALQLAAITAAGDLWNREMSTAPYTDLSCSDLAVFEREHGLNALWRAQRHARHILTLRRPAVLALASRLMDERHITF